MAAAAVQRDGISISTTIASAEDRRRLGLISSFGNAGHPARFSPPHSFDLSRFFPKKLGGNFQALQLFTTGKTPWITLFFGRSRV